MFLARLFLASEPFVLYQYISLHPAFLMEDAGRERKDKNAPPADGVVWLVNRTGTLTVLSHAVGPQHDQRA